MERRFFELEKGFLNIDGHGLYFTRSGNWQNALAAPEKTASQGSQRTFRTFIGWALMAFGVLFDLLQMSRSRPVTIALMLGFIGLGLYALYQNLRHDLVSDLCIPFRKVLGMEQDGDRTLLHYVDGDGKERVHRFRAPAEALTLIRSQLAADKR